MPGARIEKLNTRHNRVSEIIGRSQHHVQRPGCSRRLPGCGIQPTQDGVEAEQGVARHAQARKDPSTPLGH